MAELLNTIISSTGDKRRFLSRLQEAYQSQGKARYEFILAGSGSNAKVLLDDAISEVFEDKGLVVRSIKDPVHWLGIDQNDPMIVLIHTVTLRSIPTLPQLTWK
ncbi:MAG: hypothetical protein EOP45_14425 [Sphingobacteriaceae bacterium]|nr:MAG: hypothetical protein EOP45_14425 [Sphingobacteriaceae bacterium]